MMALLRLNTDIPNDVFPSNCGHGVECQQGSKAISVLPSPSLNFPPQPQSISWLHPSSHGCPLSSLAAQSHISELWLLAGTFLQEALAFHAAASWALHSVNMARQNS